jgi:hypothetical protein
VVINAKEARWGAGGQGLGIGAFGQRWGAVGAVDGAGDGLDVLLAGLVVEVFDAPFC